MNTGVKTRPQLVLGFLALGLITIVATLNGCRTPTDADREQKRSLQIKGSDTMINLGQRWAEEYMKKNPKVSIAVTGGGSGTGIAAMINGAADLAESSREMKPEEIKAARKNGIEVKEMIVALDGIAVAVHPSNPVSELAIDQLKDIFTEKIINWKEVGGHNRKIVVLSRESNSGTHVYFKEHVLRGGDEKGKGEFGPKVLLLPSSQAIIDELSSNRDAIGYFGLGYLSKRVRVVKVKKDKLSSPVMPGLETVQNGSYPIARPLFFYTKKNESKVVSSYLKWVLSEDGQKIVSALDFVPLKK